MAMELSKPWQANDFRALNKRIHCATGNMEGNSTPTAEEKEEWANVAHACQVFLKFYETNKDK